MTTDPLPPAEPDFTKPPSPNGGWSNQIDWIEKVVVVPGPDGGRVQPSGVFDGKGQYVHSAVVWSTTVAPGRLCLEPKICPTAVDQMAGRWMWGGVLINEFGHFLVESLSRIWAYGMLKDQIDGIVYIHRGNRTQLTKLQAKIFDLLGVDIPIRIITKPTSVEHLVVPGQGVGYGPIIFGTEEHNAFMRDNFAQNVLPEGAERLYISRSMLPKRKASIIAEKTLETRLERLGYKIFHPQNHPIEVQIARYRAARKILAVDGSALHLLAFCAHSNQSVGVIVRRSHWVVPIMITHLRGTMGRRPSVFNKLEVDWMLNRGEGRKSSIDHLSWGQVDMPALGHDLTQEGFLDEDPHWPPLTREEIEHFMEEQFVAIKETYKPKWTKAKKLKMRQIRQAQRRQKP